MSPNPIINMLSQASNPLGGVFNVLRTAANPMQQLQTMAMNTPQMQAVFDLINQYGVNAKQAFYAEAQRRGIDPNVAIQNILTNYVK